MIVCWWRRGTVRRVSRCLLLVVHSSYHHDPPMGQASAPSTTVSVGVWVPDMIGEREHPGKESKKKGETSPVTY